jgi:NAD(P)-dependent dehydrogenase (short-subunit alcohol dehydrogenase family)
VCAAERQQPEGDTAPHEQGAIAMTARPTTSQNPIDQEPKPPFPEQPQQPPGLEQAMEPRPDFGEQSYRGHGRLLGKRALITGADSGIGRAIALAFAREGADVLISYLCEEPDARETVRVVQEAGRKAIAVAGDISQEAHCRQLVERAVQEFCSLDILVNNAAFQRTHQSIGEIPAEEWDHTLCTKIYAMFYLCKAALPRMREGGAIINTASIQAYQPSSSLLTYASTKGAIVTFTKALAEEAIKQGVRVNCVAPGPVWTPLIPSTMPAQQVSQFGKDSPMGRPAQPAELAPIAESSYISGEVVGVTGGKPLV